MTNAAALNTLVNDLAQKALARIRRQKPTREEAAKPMLACPQRSVHLGLPCIKPAGHEWSCAMSPEDQSRERTVVCHILARTQAEQRQHNAEEREATLREQFFKIREALDVLVKEVSKNESHRLKRAWEEGRYERAVAVCASVGEPGPTRAQWGL